MQNLTSATRMDKPWRDNAKWTKPDTKTQKPVWFHVSEVLEYWNKSVRKVENGVPGAGEGGGGS